MGRMHISGIHGSGRDSRRFERFGCSGWRDALLAMHLSGARRRTRSSSGVFPGSIRGGSAASIVSSTRSSTVPARWVASDAKVQRRSCACGRIAREWTGDRRGRRQLGEAGAVAKAHRLAAGHAERWACRSRRMEWEGAGGNRSLRPLFPSRGSSDAVHRGPRHRVPGYAHSKLSLPAPSSKCSLAMPMSMLL